MFASRKPSRFPRPETPIVCSPKAAELGTFFATVNHVATNMAEDRNLDTDCVLCAVDVDELELSSRYSNNKANGIKRCPIQIELRTSRRPISCAA